MKKTTRIIIAYLPYVFAGTVIFTSVYPITVEDQSKRTELSHQQNDLQKLKSKLGDRNKVLNEQALLETDITTLRAAVPKQPDLDILMLDLEKLCKQSGVDLISIEPPEQKALKDLKASETEMKSMHEDSDGKLSMGSKTLKKATQTPGKSDAEPAPAGLKQIVRQVYLTGSYEGMVQFMTRLEHYQRVLKVAQVGISQPSAEGGGNNPAGERGKKLKLNQPVISFIMTVYYLP